VKKTVQLFFTVGAMVGVWLLILEAGLSIYYSVTDDQDNYSAQLLVASNGDQPTVYQRLVAEVTPASGITIPVVWGDMGQRLVDAGAINMDKMVDHYGILSEEQAAILQGDNVQEITFTTSNIQFWTNALWALGLTQQSKVLGEGLMAQRAEEYPIEGYASTGGWTLGSKDAVDLFNSTRLVELTPEQDDMVHDVAAHIFRPCCGNHTAFPDCNHGMAVLGLLELMASQGATEDEMYQAALAFNSYAFTSNYVNAAAYFDSQGTSWSEIDAAVVLGQQYSSGQGAKQIAAQVGTIPGAPGSGSGGGCSA